MSKILNNKLILGTVQMGLPYGINNTLGQISFEESMAILDHAYASGIEILDSAEAYGKAHSVIGSFHKKNPSKQFKVITKLPNDPQIDITKKVGDYLDELRVEQLHALLFHSFIGYKDAIDKFDELRLLKTNGRINNIGVSVYTNEEVEEVLDNDDIDIVQVPFNVFDNTTLRGKVLEKAKQRGKTIHTRSALLQGLFFKTSDDKTNIVQHLRNELECLFQMTQKYNVTVAEIALSYCFQEKSIDNVLIGVDSLQQLKDNIRSVKYEIPQDLVNEINMIHIQNKNLLNPSLW